MTLKCNAVFEGGGVKGIGLAGAIMAVEKAGYSFVNLAGTSAGAIAAALLAVGYTGEEIANILQNLDYLKFKDATFLDKTGILGRLFNTLFRFGIYEGAYFENWIEKLFQAKGKTTFGDIKLRYPANNESDYKFQAIASDLTSKRMLVLPQDLKEFGYDPDKFSLSKAVRMSMSIPIFFEPYKLKDNVGTVHFIVDGGVLSNYPMWLLDDGTSDPRWPTFGFKLIENSEEHQTESNEKSIKNIISFLEALIGTMTDAHDNYHISVSKGDYARTIGISTTIKIGGKVKKIGTTDFDLSKGECKMLLGNGIKSAEKFLSTWDFAAWKRKYRENRILQIK